MPQPCVYILASQTRGTLYVRVTGNVLRRVWEHRTGAAEGFTQCHGVYTLVHVEFHSTMEEAILREKRVKKWRRAWKIQLIEAGNPFWRDLYDDLAR
jgi:putative endonuclease